LSFNQPLMDRLSFDLFEPDKKWLHLTPNGIVFILWGVTIFFLWAFDSVLPAQSTGRSVWLAIVLLISFYYLITSFFKYRPLNGQINGKIIFQSESFTIGNKVFDLKDITSVDFGFADFYGKMSSNGRDFSPKFSQGVNNYISFTDDKNQPQKFYFRMMTKNSSITLHPFINEAVKRKAMSYDRAIELIDVENVIKP